MKKPLNKILLFICLITVWGCDDPGAFDCIKKSGDIITEEIQLSQFNRIFLEDDITLEIGHGESQRVFITGGENLIPAVIFNIVGKDLTISNNNKCNWTRNYEPMVVNITTNQLQLIQSSGFGNINSINTLSFDNLTIESKDGSGDFNVIVDTGNLRVVNNSLSNITVVGNTDILTVSHWYNDGKFNGSQLEANRTNVIHNGVNTIKIRPVDRLSGAINSRGNVLYFGNPSEIDVTITGDGRLIQQ